MSELAEAAVAAGPDPVIAMNGDGLIVLWNRAAARVFGYSANQVLGRSVSEVLIPEELRESHQLALRHHSRVGSLGHRDFDLVQARSASGELVPVEMRVQQCTDPDGGRLYVAFLREVPGRLAAELALAASNTRLADAQRIGRIGSWEYDAATGRTLWSDEFFRLHGLGRGGQPNLGALISVAHPDDRARVKAWIESVIAGSLAGASDLDERELEYRVVCDGEIRIIRGQLRAFFDSSGRPVRLSGVSQDITDLRRAQEREHQLAGLVDHAHDGMALLWPDGTIASWNAGLERILGVSAKDALGTNISRFVVGEGLEVQSARLSAVRDSRSTVLSEAILAHADGAEVPVEITLAPICHDNGELFGIAGVLRDVQERRRIEVAERASRAKNEFPHA